MCRGVSLRERENGEWGKGVLFVVLYGVDRGADVFCTIGKEMCQLH